MGWTRKKVFKIVQSKLFRTSSIGKCENFQETSVNNYEKNLTNTLTKYLFCYIHRDNARCPQTRDVCQV